MLVFWVLMVVSWVTLMILHMANGEPTDHEAVMGMLCIVLLNLEAIKRKIGGE